MDNKKNFIKFLKKRKVWAKFKQNLDENTALYVHRIPTKDLILLAFVWCDTSEGHNYWMNLDKEWQKFNV